jgi:hypothetical protein
MDAPTPPTDDELVPLAEAQRLCREKLRWSAARFRRALAENVRSGRGIPWQATETAVGVCRQALDALVKGEEKTDE